MFYRPFSPCFVLGCILLLSSPLWPGERGRQLYDDLSNNTFKQVEVAEISDFKLVKGSSVLEFGNGKLYRYPNPDRAHTMVFVGDGVLRMELPNDIERQQALRFLNTIVVAEPFEAALLYFTDSTCQIIANQLTFEPSQAPRSVGRLARFVSGYLLTDLNYNIFARIAEDISNGVSGAHGWFCAVLEQSPGQLNLPSYLMFIHDPIFDENVTLYQHFPYAAPKKFYTVLSYRDTADIALPTTLPFEISNYRLMTRLESNGEANLAATIQLKSNLDSLRVLHLDLLHELEVDSVNMHGQALEFVREKKDEGLCIFLPKTLAADQHDSLTVYFKGMLFEQYGSNYWLKDKLLWYPRPGHLNDSPMTMTYDYPERIQLLSVGQKSSERKHDGRKISIWQATVPVMAMSFAMGFLDSTRYELPGCELTIYSADGGPKSVRQSIGQDVAGTLFFLESLLGAYPYKKLDVVETPGQLSNGFRGLLLLTTHSYGRSASGPLVAIRAHETSHQWWGNLVDWKTYHDQWLSEALAEYCGALITQFARGDKEGFTGALEGWHADLVHRGHVAVRLGLRRFGFSERDLRESEGMAAGPIWLGRRLGTKYPIDYFVNVYEKGAFVMHMLRVMLRDFEKEDDYRFLSLLKDFVQTYAGKNADTADFEAIVARHFEQDMSWFFKQWIYGTDIPSYRYKIRHVTFNDSFYVNLAVTQEDVEEIFLAFIPVKAEFSDGTSSTEIIEMQGHTKSFQLGPWPTKPDKILFNDFHGVLARVREE